MVWLEVEPDPDLETEAGLVAVAGLETEPLGLRAVLVERLLVLPMLMPPLIVPPDVFISGLDECPDDGNPAIGRVLSVLARRP